MRAIWSTLLVYGIAFVSVFGLQLVAVTALLEQQQAAAAYLAAPGPRRETDPLEHLARRGVVMDLSRQPDVGVLQEVLSERQVTRRAGQEREDRHVVLIVGGHDEGLSSGVVREADA